MISERPLFARLSAQLTAASFILVGSSAIAHDRGELHSFHCLHGCPIGTPDFDDIVVREIYTLASNDLTKVADWVAYRITPETIGPSGDRNWAADSWLADEETLEPDDYKDASDTLGIDRGHQAPLAAFSGTAFKDQTNILSNITPQGSALNQAPWQRLEAKEIDLVQAENIALYVLTGPLFERMMPKLPKANERHRVPSAYWKVIVTVDGRVAAFIMDTNEPRDLNHCQREVTLDEVELRARLGLFPRLDTRNFTSLAPALGCPTN